MTGRRRPHRNLRPEVRDDHVGLQLSQRDHRRREARVPRFPQLRAGESDAADLDGVDVAKNFGFTVKSNSRTLAVCSNLEIARAAWECACKIFPRETWVLLWGGMLIADSDQPAKQERI